MIKIGLCGSSGAGKGYVCKKFTNYGVAWIDTDKVYREITLMSGNCLKELCEYFGNDILVDGRLDRKILASRVFEGDGAEKRLSMLNSITHKHIKRDTEAILEELEKNGCKAVLIDAPVLFESGFDKMCDATICVTSPLDSKIQRIMKRDGISKEKAIARLNTQLSDDELRRKCTYEIDNTDGRNLQEQINSILKELDIEA